MYTKQNMGEEKSSKKAPGTGFAPIGSLKVEKADSNYKPGDHMGVGSSSEAKVRSMEPSKA